VFGGVGIDEREVLPSHDCEVCSTEQRLKSGAATVARDWATRRSEPWDSKMEIPAHWRIAAARTSCDCVGTKA